ncbi:MAG TPA: DUF6160 family protein [Aquabacterium sp.]|nr:DUF6160 family protein [Aquabacterium sp.]
MKKWMSLTSKWWRAVAVAGACLSCAGSALAAVEELHDEDLSAVTGADGVRIDLHLEWRPNRTEVELSSAISVGFYEAQRDLNTFIVMRGFGGVVDFWGLAIDARAGPADVGDYIDVTLPAYVGFDHFGFQSLSAQNDKNAVPTYNYGQWLLNGSATVTGNVYIWPAK